MTPLPLTGERTVPGIPAEQLYLRGLEMATAAGFG